MSASEGSPAGPEAPGWPGSSAQAPAAQVEPYRPLGGLSRWLVGLLLVLVASYAVTVVATLIVYGLGEYSTPTRLDRYSGGEVALAVVGFVQSLLYIAVAVLFLTWFHRAYRNLRPLGASPPRRRPGWAIGAWFVPIVDLVMPKLMANEIWLGGEPEGGGRPDRETSIPLFHHLWWALWVLSFVAGFVVGVESGVTAGLGHDSSSASGAMAVVLGLLSAASAALAMLVVRRSSERQDTRWHRRAGLAARGDGQGAAWTTG